MRVVKFFIETLRKGKAGSITATDFDYYLDFSQFEYGEIFDDEKREKPDMVGRLESSHYILSFLFDLLQFCFQYLVKADKVATATQNDSSRSRFFDPSAPLSLEDDFSHPLSLSFYIEDFNSFVSLICNTIGEICPQTDYLMRFWQIKHAEDPTLAEKVLSIDDKDTYERTDNYNVYGLFCFFAMRSRNAFLEWTGKSSDSRVVMIDTAGKYQTPNRHAFNFEIYHPLLEINMRSKSETVRALAYEMIDMYAYMLQGDGWRQIERLSVFQTDESVVKKIFTRLFSQLGE